MRCTTILGTCREIDSPHLKTFADVTCVNRKRDKHDPFENPQRAQDGQLIISRFDKTVSDVFIDFWYTIIICWSSLVACYFGFLRKGLCHDDVCLFLAVIHVDEYVNYLWVRNDRWKAARAGESSIYGSNKVHKLRLVTVLHVTLLQVCNITGDKVLNPIDPHFCCLDRSRIIDPRPQIRLQLQSTDLAGSNPTTYSRSCGVTALGIGWSTKWLFVYHQVPTLLGKSASFAWPLV